MKKQYQIDQQRAVQQFRRLATQENPHIQMVLPISHIVGMLQDGVGHLLREAGLALMNLVMEEDIRHLAGERHEQRLDRRAHRWGKEDGYCVVDGQKVPLKRTRLRTKENREQLLGSYELFQRILLPIRDCTSWTALAIHVPRLLHALLDLDSARCSHYTSFRMY
jgi:putative transposase